MKIITTIILFVYSSFLLSQTWQTLSLPSNINGQRYDDVFFLDANLGWAANGYYAAVYKTEDGGRTWSEQINETDLGTDHYFRNIEFLNEQVGFLGTLNGKFYQTVDGGTTWNLVSIVPNPAAICGIDAVGDTTIYGCGAYFTPAFIIKSDDKGESWSYIDMSEYATALVEIKFLDESIGFASGSNADGACVLKTVDGGITWSELYNSEIPGQYVWKLNILKENENVLFGAIESFNTFPGKLIKSTDSGSSWVETDAPDVKIQAVGFISETKGWMGGHDTGIHETEDGGITWKNLNFGSNLNRIFVIDNEKVFAAGTSIYKYSNESLGINNEAYSNSNNLKITLLNNPVKSTLKFKIDFPSPDNVLIELYNQNGQFIKYLDHASISEQGVKNHSFDVSELTTALYFIMVHNNFNRQVVHFIKE